MELKWWKGVKVNKLIWNSGARIRPRLTRRQREVLEALADGSTSAEIAVTLALTPRTVYQHIYRLKQLFGASTSAQLVGRATQMGLLKERV